jgi:AcrR family transcriptional regulator
MTRHLSEAERRTQILRAARAVFVERGYLAARMEDVARRARLSKGAVYFYFESKHALFEALVEEEQAVTLSFLDGAARDPRPAAVRLVEVGTRYVEHFAGLKSPPRFFLHMAEMAIRDEGIRQRVSAMHHLFVERLAALIAEGVAEGSFKALDPMAAAMVLKAVVDGLSGQSAIGVRPDVERLSTDGLRMILNGLGAEGAWEGGR